jgi:hypothetical protein
MQLQTKIIVRTLAAILFGCAKEEQPATQPVDNLTAAEARVLAHEAYVVGRPLLYYAVNQAVITNVPKAADPSNRTTPFGSSMSEF